LSVKNGFYQRCTNVNANENLRSYYTALILPQKDYSTHRSIHGSVVVKAVHCHLQYVGLIHTLLTMLDCRGCRPVTLIRLNGSGTTKDKNRSLKNNHKFLRVNIILSANMPQILL